MKKQLWTLPLYLILVGIMIRTTNFTIGFLAMRITSEWTLEMGAAVTWLNAALSAVFFVLIGLRLRKVYDRKTCFLSATLLVIYNALTLAAEQWAQHAGTYSLLNYLIQLPSDLFISFASLLGMLSNSTIFWPAVIVSLFAPYLFLLFTKKQLPAPATVPLA